MDVNQKKYTYVTGILSIIINVMLYFSKLWIGIISGSVALMADAWHTLSDSLTSIVLLISIKLSLKPADETHPYGHGRIELIGAIIIGLFLGVVAFNFFIESVNRIINHEPAHYGLTAFIVTAASMLVKEIMARYSICIGKKNNIKSLIADGWHHRSDAVSSLVILIGIILGKYYWWIDGALGIIVSMILAYVVYEILKETISSFLGEKPDDAFILELHSLVKDVYQEDIHIHHIHLHTYGNHKELTFHIHLPKDITLVTAHNIATRIEQHIKQIKGIETTIHFEPHL